MARDEVVIDSHSFRLKEARKMISGNRKAAKIADSSFTRKQRVKGERWFNALQTYSDYFIRY